jgi:hypothetical protein
MFKKEISRVAVVCLFSWLAFAQSQNGRILGTVTDPSGAVVVGAKVVITDSECGISQTYTSNASGDYVAPTLRPALYTITAESAGFKKVERPAIRLGSRPGPAHRFSVEDGVRSRSGDRDG